MWLAAAATRSPPSAFRSASMLAASMNGATCRTGLRPTIRPSVHGTFIRMVDCRRSAGDLDRGPLPVRPGPTDAGGRRSGRDLRWRRRRKGQPRLEQRQDVLTYTSDVLPLDVEVIGPVAASIVFRSSLEHTDVVARLCDVHPDGRSSQSVRWCAAPAAGTSGCGSRRYAHRRSRPRGSRARVPHPDTASPADQQRRAPAVGTQYRHRRTAGHRRRPTTSRSRGLSRPGHTSTLTLPVRATSIV